MTPRVPVPPSIPVPEAGQSFDSWVAQHQPEVLAARDADDCDTDSYAAGFRVGRLHLVFQLWQNRLTSPSSEDDGLVTAHAFEQAHMRARRARTMETLAERLVNEGDAAELALDSVIGNIAADANAAEVWHPAFGRGHAEGWADALKWVEAQKAGVAELASRHPVAPVEIVDCAEINTAFNTGREQGWSEALEYVVAEGGVLPDETDERIDNESYIRGYDDGLANSPTSEPA